MFLSYLLIKRYETKVSIPEANPSWISKLITDNRIIIWSATCTVSRHYPSTSSFIWRLQLFLFDRYSWVLWRRNARLVQKQKNYTGIYDKFIYTTSYTQIRSKRAFKNQILKRSCNWFIQCFKLTIISLIRYINVTIHLDQNQNHNFDVNGWGLLIYNLVHVYLMSLTLIFLNKY